MNFILNHDLAQRETQARRDDRRDAASILARDPAASPPPPVRRRGRQDVTPKPGESASPPTSHPGQYPHTAPRYPYSAPQPQPPPLAQQHQAQQTFPQPPEASQVNNDWELVHSQLRSEVDANLQKSKASYLNTSR